MQGLQGVGSLCRYIHREITKHIRRILGPEYPPVSRIRSFYIKNIILKLERKLSYAKAKQAILRLNEEMYASVSKNHIRIITDVDPQ